VLRPAQFLGSRVQVKGVPGTGTCAALLLLGFCACPGPRTPSPGPQAPGQALPTVALSIGTAVARVEVADEGPDRMQGLMFRSSLAPDSGMLFVFESEAPRSFWMKNTWIPLSIAFIDRFGVIANILEMAPGDSTTHYPSSRPVTFALEMNAGWFLQHGIKPGDTVRGLSGTSH